jgi:hypothetical protein
MDSQYDWQAVTTKLPEYNEHRSNKTPVRKSRVSKDYKETKTGFHGSPLHRNLLSASARKRKAASPFRYVSPAKAILPKA